MNIIECIEGKLSTSPKTAYSIQITIDPENPNMYFSLVANGRVVSTQVIAREQFHGVQNEWVARPLLEMLKQL